MRRHLRQNAQSDSDDDHVVAPVLQSVGNLLLDGFRILSEQYLDVVASISQAIARAVHAGDNLLRAYTPVEDSEPKNRCTEDPVR